MFFVGAMGKIQAGNFHAGSHQLADDSFGIACRT
jgi:hypothetical protein